MKDLTKYIAVIYRRSQMFYNEQLKDLEVSSGQFMYIVSICEHPGQTQDELSELLLIDKSTAAKVLTQLEANGFITKTTHSSDKRAFHIFPTAKALGVYPIILSIKASWHERITEQFSDIERDMFERLLEKALDSAIRNYK